VRQGASATACRQRRNQQHSPRRQRNLGPARTTASIVTGATAVPRNPEKVWIEKARPTRAGAVVGNCCHAWNKLVDQPWTILSIGLCEWAHEY
jgi:hypothetical protein